MPIITITDYTWRQTLEEIIITVPIVGKSRDIHVLAIDNYVKASYPPFILELFLWANIVEEESHCAIGKFSAVFSLRKADMGVEWPYLVLEGLDKIKKREYRNRAEENACLSAEKRAKKRREKYQELQRLAVKKQIQVDGEVLKKIEAVRDGHRNEAMAEFDSWRSTAEKPILNTADPMIYRTCSDCHGNRSAETGPKTCDDRGCSRSSNEETENNPKLPRKLSTLKEELTSIEKHKSSADKNKQRGQKIIDQILSGKFRLKMEKKIDNTEELHPKPRECGKITVKFSERIFPTPARESHHLEEQEWLAKQVEARRKCGFASEDLRPEEQDPQWLKDKGDEFFKVGNYFAAVSAYTHGIKLSDRMASLYANRSAAQYALKNYRRCAKDCSTALELMVPKCEGNRESRARCHARLGAALCKLSAPQHGIPELQAALKLAPDNDTIKRDLTQAHQFFHFVK